MYAPSSAAPLNPDDFTNHLSAIAAQQEFLDEEAKKLGTDPDKLMARIRNIKERRGVLSNKYWFLKNANAKNGKGHDVQATFEYLIARQSLRNQEQMLFEELIERLEKKLATTKEPQDAVLKTERYQLLDICAEVMKKIEELCECRPGLKSTLAQQQTLFSVQYHDFFVILIEKRDASELTALYLTKLFSAVTDILNWHRDGKSFNEHQLTRITDTEKLSQLRAIHPVLYAHAETFTTRVEAYLESQAVVFALEKSKLGLKLASVRQELSACKSDLKQLAEEDIPEILEALKELKSEKAAEKATSAKAAQAADRAAMLAPTDTSDINQGVLGWMWKGVTAAASALVADERAEVAAAAPKNTTNGRQIMSYGSTKRS